MARSVFFSFHYQRDIMRVQIVKRHYVTTGNYTAAGFFDGSLEEKAETEGDDVVKRLINDGPKGVYRHLRSYWKRDIYEALGPLRDLQEYRNGNGGVWNSYSSNPRCREGFQDSGRDRRMGIKSIRLSWLRTP